MEWEKGGGKERDGFHGKYDFFTFCLVPGLTLWLASMESWFGTNLSVVCSRGGLRLGFALWGIVTGLYYGFYTFYLFRLNVIPRKSGAYAAETFPPLWRIPVLFSIPGITGNRRPAAKGGNKVESCRRY